MTFSQGPRMATRRNFCATALLHPENSKGGEIDPRQLEDSCLTPIFEASYGVFL